MSLPNQTPTSVVVFSGDQLVGHALELLLRNVGYDARFLTEASFDKPGLLHGAQILLFAAGLSARQREAYTTFIKSTPAMARVPILNLVSFSDGARAGTENFVPWPCLMEELKRRIDVAVLGGSRPEGREVSYG